MKGAAKTRRFVRERGAALVVTLVLVSILSIVVISYLLVMRIHMKTSHAFEDSQRVKLMGQSAISHGVELLRHNIPDPARITETSATAPPDAWFVNPGRLSIFDGKDFRHVELHTGELVRNPSQEEFPNAESVDLNLPPDRHPIICYGQDEEGRPDPDLPIPEMRVLWKNVLRDPSEPASKENPIVGRYAFWIDDESSKLNFNVSSGKPGRSGQAGARFWEQYDSGMMTPAFERGTRYSEAQQSEVPRQWGLGKLRSVNLDVLGDRPSDIDRDALFEQTWENGFFHYPEAITQFLNVDDPDEWYHQQKYNLTPYSRSPEFNAFGRPRLFSARVPLSLESGPAYQLPFEVESGGESILHNTGLMGELGNSVTYAGEWSWNGPNLNHAASAVNSARVEDIMGYLRRPWPGYTKSFVDKYGEAECYQIALNLLAEARMATSLRDDTRRLAGSQEWAYHSTDLNYMPPDDIRVRENPERQYWRFEIDGEEKLMLPQNRGPFVTDLRVILRTVPARAYGLNVPLSTVVLRYEYEVEYYIPAHGPQVHLATFPILMDYLQIDVMDIDPYTNAEIGAQAVTRHLAPPEPGTEIAARDWTIQPGIGDAKAWAISAPGQSLESGFQIAPINRAVDNNSPFDALRGSQVSNRKVVSTNFSYHFLMANRDYRMPWRSNELALFDISESDLEINFKIRLGMSALTVRNGVLYADRPRQMIPLGETEEDTLQGSVRLSRIRGENRGPRQMVSFSILDPRLSSDKTQWIVDETGGEIAGPYQGDPGPLDDEPEETSSEKSKMRGHPRGGASIQSAVSPSNNFELNKPDEFSSNSVVSSKGYYSMIHTGMQSGVPWRTMNLGPSSSDSLGDPPDYLLLDLLGATHPMQRDQWIEERSTPDQFSTVSYMNSTAGQINLNTRPYPRNHWFQVPERKKPLEAVFKHLRSDGEVEDLVEAISDYQASNDGFAYVGELAEVSGYLPSTAPSGGTPTQFDNEELLRNMAGCLTTRSNTFGLWGVAQVIKKARIPQGAGSYGTMAKYDKVTAERHFYALIERYIWEGKDGIPGNGHLGTSGRWDRVSSPSVDYPGGETPDRLFNLPGSPAQIRQIHHPATLTLNPLGTHPVFDGPEKVGMSPSAGQALGGVEWESSPIDEAYNPPQPMVKYRIVYLKYFDS